MKRFILVVVLMFVVLGVMLYFAPKPFAKRATQFSPDSVITVFCRQTDLPSVDLGNGKLVVCNSKNLRDTLFLCKGVDGISVRFSGSLQDFYALQRQLQLCSESCVKMGELTVVCGYSPKICGGVALNGQRVNVQIAFDGNTVTVGYPLILNGY